MTFSYLCLFSTKWRRKYFVINNPLDIYHSIQSGASVCHFFLRKQICCFYNWQSVVSYHIQVLIDEVCLIFDRNQARKRTGLFVAENNEWQKGEDEHGFAEQQREVSQAR